jgi:hypothetical protein
MLQNTAISAVLFLFHFCLTIEEVGFMVLNAKGAVMAVIVW